MARVEQGRREFCLGLGGLVILGCGAHGKGGAIADGKPPDNVTGKLRRRWLLVEFTPTDPLDPVLDGFLTAQLGHMVIDVGDGTLDVSGPSIELLRNYEVVRALFDRADVVVFGDDGTTYEVSLQLRPNSNDVDFACKTAPWKGNGRMTPAAEPDPLAGM
ncbi:MAG: hypothetical protein JW751_02640 [Polyangiaceae bacterium]|nr:hypothetical protein [Polyangiaceae bacterium]